MEEIKIGENVSFKRNSTLPEEWDVPNNAVGMVIACYPIRSDQPRICLDVDFGPNAGVLCAVDAAEFVFVG
jgi:hypothetical protein